jgi:quercetin dioxygenase-like cupin family protein
MTIVAARPQAKATVQVSDDRVIVTEWRFAPDAETGWHRHGHDYVVVPMTTGTLMIEGPNGSKTMAPMTAGVSYARKIGVEHNVVNASPHEFTFIEIEIR